jgi:hypothetical protein
MTRNEAKQVIHYGKGIEYETKGYTFHAFVQVEKVQGVAERVYYLTDTAKDTQWTNEYAYDDADALLHAVSEVASITKWSAAKELVSP